MKRIFTLLAAAWCSMAALAQSFQLETKDGTVIPNGASVTLKSEIEDMMIWGQMNAHVYARNLTENNMGLIAEMKAVSGGESQICWGGKCVTVAVGDTYTTGTGVASAGEANDLEIHALINGDFKTAVATRTVELSVWNENNPAEKISATITFTNDEKVLAANITGVQTNAYAVYAKDNVLYYNFSDAAARRLQLFDVAGQLQKELRLSSEAGSLPLEGMSKGIYLYRVVENGRKAVSGKLLVK